MRMVYEFSIRIGYVIFEGRLVGSIPRVHINPLLHYIESTCIRIWYAFSYLLESNILTTIIYLHSQPLSTQLSLSGALLFNRVDTVRSYFCMN